MSASMAEVETRPRRTLANLDEWKDQTRLADSTGRMQRKKPVAEKFWPRVDVRSDNECWEWQGAKLPSGHGCLHIGDIGTLPHRVAWALTNGNIPNGLVVCHRCDNPPCCNPKHLFIGTQQDNVQDCMNKDRMHRGTRTGGAVLNDDLVRAIRSEYAKGGTSQLALGNRYDVDQNTIWKIVNHVTWRRVA